MSLNHAGNEYAARLAAQSRTPEAQKVAPKIYFHQFNYAKFHFDLGGSHVKTVQFARNRYITDDKREQDQLDLVADAPGTFIYTIPDSDVAAAIAQELNQEAANTVMRTAQAAAAVNGQMYDPNVPVIPVNVQQVSGTAGLQVSMIAPQPAVANGGGVVGLQNSMSGSSTTESNGPAHTVAAGQTRAPTAADEAMARLAALTGVANNAAAAAGPASDAIS